MARKRCHEFDIKLDIGPCTTRIQNPSVLVFPSFLRVGFRTTLVLSASATQQCKASTCQKSGWLKRLCLIGPRDRGCIFSSCNTSSSVREKVWIRMTSIYRLHAAVANGGLLICTAEHSVDEVGLDLLLWVALVLDFSSVADGTCQGGRARVWRGRRGSVAVTQMCIGADIACTQCIGPLS